MPRPRTSPLAPRKTPKQQRSAQLVEAILKAAVRVLERGGAGQFTTIHVAKEAGVSVGSLYQYFPNKASILFRLQQEEWSTTGRLLDGIFRDERLAPRERLREALRAFFRTEYEEAPLRRALGDAESLYRESPSARQHREKGLPVLIALMGAAAPHLTRPRRVLAADLYVALFASMGKHVSETARSPAEVDRWAAATADMFLAYLRQQDRGGDHR